MAVTGAKTAMKDRCGCGIASTTPGTILELASSWKVDRGVTVDRLGRGCRCCKSTKTNRYFEN